MSLDDLCINTIRMLSVDGVQQANSGHPGLPMGAAPMAYTLWSRHLKHNPANPKWPDRDRFVLSGGHGSMLLYSLLYLTGYDLSLDEIKNFRQWGSKTPGHPEYHITPGAETTTGPLGQGFATAVGMAMAEAHLAAVYNSNDYPIVDHFTYVLASDGDLMEGVAAEAASLAGHLRLGKLIVLYDSNDISLAGRTNLTFTEDVAERFRAYDWDVITVENGNSVEAIDDAICQAQADERPSLIIVKTIIGFGSPNKADTHEAHGSPLGKDEVLATRRNLGWPEQPDFYVPEEALSHFRTAVERGAAAESAWRDLCARWRQANPELAAQWDTAIAGTPPEGWDSLIPTFGPKDAAATRASAGVVLNAIAQRYPALMGGSADLNPSTNTALKGMGDFQPPARRVGDLKGAVGGPWGYEGRNIHFGVREHAMAAAANGMALHGGVRPYVATFFNFLDYLKPALRLSALMEQPVVYVFTHDSIALGEDGPTHQPIEQLASLRATPNVVTIRPADPSESAAAWRVAVERLDGPTALVLSRQKLPNLDHGDDPDALQLKKGAYILKEPASGPDLVLIGTGSEVSLALEAAKVLETSGVHARVVSMPSWELFEQQPEEYRSSVLPKELPKLAVEAASPLGWERYAQEVIGMRRFGASAPAERLMQEFGFTPEAVAERALELLRGFDRS
jgi:transketolase